MSAPEGVPGDDFKGWLEQEQGGKFGTFVFSSVCGAAISESLHGLSGGKFAKWVRLFFVINGGDLRAYDNEDQDGSPLFEVKTTDCAVRLPKTERKGRPSVFRIDTTTKQKLMVDPGSDESRERWVVEMGNAGANVPGEYADKIDVEKASKLVKRGSKKNWMNMKTPLGWKPFWFEFAIPELTYHERPGAEAKGTVDIAKLEISLGSAVEADLGRELSWKTLQRDSTAPISLPWSGLAADSQQEYDSWVHALSTRKIKLVKSAAEDFGLELDNSGVVLDLKCEPDGEPGPAEILQVRTKQRVVEVNGVEVGSKEDILNAFRPPNVIGGLDEVELTLEGVGDSPIGVDETEEDYLARLAREDEERMRIEMENEEAMAARAEQELQDRIQAEKEAHEQRAKDEAERQAREEQEFQEGFGRIMQLSQSFSGKSAVETAKILSSDVSRRLYKEGLLSKQKDDKKRDEMERGIGRTYYFLFSDMLVACKRKEKGSKMGKIGGGMGKLSAGKIGGKEKNADTSYEGFEIESVVSAEQLKNARVISHSYNADETERRGIEVVLPGMPVLYAASQQEQAEWVHAFKRVLFGLLEGDARAGYKVHHMLCAGTLFYAALHGDLPTVQRAISVDSTAAASVDEYGATPLMLAAQAGHTDVVLSIMSAGQADVNTTDVHGDTAGHLAARACQTEVLGVLGTYDFNFNKANLRDEVPIGILVETGATEAARKIAAQGAVVDRVDRSGRSGLHAAVQKGSVAEVQRWLTIGANPDKTIVDRTRKSPILMASELNDASICLEIVKSLLDSGANPNKPGDRTGVVVLQKLLELNYMQAADACVRAGGRYRSVAGMTSELKIHFDELASEYAAEKKRADEIAASLAEVGGAAALAADTSCAKADFVTVRCSKWCRKYFVLTRETGQGKQTLHMYRFASDVATQPEHMATVDPAASAVEFGDGQPSVGDFGLDLYGVGDAAVSGLGFGGKLARIATAEEEDGLYKFSFETSSGRQEWLNVLKSFGVGVDISMARREATTAQLRVGDLMGETSTGSNGAAQGTAAVLEGAKSQLTENIDKLQQMSEATQEMENASSDFADMAKVRNSNSAVL